MCLKYCPAYSANGNSVVVLSYPQLKVRQLHRQVKFSPFSSSTYTPHPTPCSHLSLPTPIAAMSGTSYLSYLRYEGCGHICRKEPDKYPEDSLLIESPALAGQQHDNKDTKGKGKEVLEPTELADQIRDSDSIQTKTSRRSSVSTLSSIDIWDPKAKYLIPQAPQALCPPCFNTEEDRLCEAYAKRVNFSLKMAEKSGLSESETLHVCTTMETDHQNELRDFHLKSGYQAAKDKEEAAEKPVVATQTLKGLFASAKNVWAKSTEPRCASPTFKKANTSSDNLAIVRAQWGESRSARRGSNSSTRSSIGRISGDNDSGVAVARPRRDGTRFAFPVRVPSSLEKLKEAMDAIKTVEVAKTEGSRKEMTDEEIAEEAEKWGFMDRS